MSKGLKIGIIGGLVLLAILIVWYFMKGGADSSFTAMPGKDVFGFDIEEAVTSGTVAQDAQHALDINAVAFLRRGGKTWYKSAKSPVISDPTSGGTLYVKK